jgi:hypothetical protein
MWACSIMEQFSPLGSECSKTASSFHGQPLCAGQPW